MATSTPIPSAVTARKSRYLKLLLLAAIAGAVYCWWAYQSTDSAFGRFEGEVVTKWITDDLEMQLIEDFKYVDPRGKHWTAPTGSVINGASIPSMFWSVIGGPFEGRFRKASVLHDAACDEQTESWQDVHQMFYDACRCSRVGVGKAQTMYWAVYHFGPRWRQVTEQREENGRMVTVTRTIREELVQPEASIAAKADRYFAKKQFTPKEIEECTVEQLEAEVAKWDAAQGSSEDD
jgi:hypothetical protein